MGSSRWNKYRPAAVHQALFAAAHPQWWLEGFPFNGVTKADVNRNSKGQTFPQYSVCGSFTTSAADNTATEEKNLAGSYMMGWDWGPNRTVHKKEKWAQTENIHSQARGWASVPRKNTQVRTWYIHTTHTHPELRCYQKGVDGELRLRVYAQSMLNLQTVCNEPSRNLEMKNQIFRDLIHI